MRPESASYQRQLSRHKRKANKEKNKKISLEQSNNEIKGIDLHLNNIENVENVPSQYGDQTKTDIAQVKNVEYSSKVNLATMFMTFQLQKMGFYVVRFEPIIKKFISKANLQEVSVKNLRKWVLNKKSQIVDLIFMQKGSSMLSENFMQKHQSLSLSSELLNQNITHRNEGQLQIQSKIEQNNQNNRKSIQTSIIKVSKKEQRKEQVQPKIQQQIQRMIICPICLVETRKFMQRNCAHIFCKDCIRSYILQNNYNGNYLIDCPELACPNKISQNQAAEVLGRRDLQRFIKFKQKITLQNNPNNKFCTKPDCGRLLVENQSNKLFCKVCKITFCGTCQQQNHQGKDCGQAMLKQVEQAYRNFRIKKCPSCSSPIQKIDGCNHMTCKKCKFQFCWICLEKYTPYHYRIYNCCGCPGLQFEEVEEKGYKRFLQVLFFIFLPVFIAIAISAVFIILPLYMIFNFITRPCKWVSEEEKCQIFLIEKLCCCFPQCIRAFFGYLLFIPRSILYAVFVSPFKYFISVGNLICNIV